MRLTIAALSLVVLVIATPGPEAAQQTSPQRVQAFVGARLIDGSAAPVENAVIVVRDGRVESAGPASSVRPPAGAAITDLAGQYVVPGFISAHAHVSDVQGTKPRAYTDENTVRQLGVYARYGITSVWSLGGEQAPAFRLRDAQAMPSLDRARIFLAGEIVTGATPEAARQAVARVAATKPDVIKIRVDDNLGASQKMAPAVYRAVIEEAHRLGLRVAAHIYYLDDAKDLLRAGVDVIAHSVRDREIDDEFISLMKARNVPYCPTLTREIATFVYESTPGFFSDPLFLREADPDMVALLQQPARQTAMRTSKSAQAYKAALPTAQKNLAKAAAAGVLIAMDTDSGAFPERFQGYFEHLEMTMMAESGLTPAQVLRASTVDAARAMQVSDIGRLTAGAWADFVALDRSPLENITHTRSISGVWTAGNRLRR